MKKTVIATILLLAGSLFSLDSAEATGLAGPVELEGFAWSSTVGWISMNCSNDGLSGCGTSDYKVQVETDGSMTGYAWSSNIGWIRFGGLSGFPSGASTVSQNATANGSYPNLVLEGWARACAAAANPSSCSGGLGVHTGGWDGWISLSGDLYSVEFVNAEATANSFAWGGPNTMGWIDFSPDAAIGPPISPVMLGAVADIVIPSASITLGTPNVSGFYDTLEVLPNVQGIPLGETVVWNLTLGGLTDSGTVTQTIGGPDFSSRPTVANVPFNVTDVLTFEVDMPEPGVVREINETNIYTEIPSLAFPPPTIVISGPEIIRSGEPAEVSWEISAPYPVVCTAQGPGIDETIIVSGAVGLPDTQSGSRESAPLQNAARFEVSCVVGADTYTEVYQVEVTPTFQEI